MTKIIFAVLLASVLGGVTVRSMLDAPAQPLTAMEEIGRLTKGRHFACRATDAFGRKFETKRGCWLYLASPCASCSRDAELLVDRSASKATVPVAFWMTESPQVLGLRGSMLPSNLALISDQKQDGLPPELYKWAPVALRIDPRGYVTTIDRKPLAHWSELPR